MKYCNRVGKDFFPAPSRKYRNPRTIAAPSIPKDGRDTEPGKVPTAQQHQNLALVSTKVRDEVKEPQPRVSMQELKRQGNHPAPMKTPALKTQSTSRQRIEATRQMWQAKKAEMLSKMAGAL